MRSLSADKASVPVVLDGIVAAPQQSLAEKGPLVAALLTLLLHQVEDPVFLRGPGAELEQRVQMVVPPLSTLLPRAIGDAIGDHVPVAGADE